LNGFDQVEQNIGRFSINSEAVTKVDLEVSGFWASIQVESGVSEYRMDVLHELGARENVGIVMCRLYDTYIRCASG